jgi:predicted nucleic acid-binding protein
MTCIDSVASRLQFSGRRQHGQIIDNELRVTNPF